MCRENPIKNWVQVFGCYLYARSCTSRCGGFAASLIGEECKKWNWLTPAALLAWPNLSTSTRNVFREQLFALRVRSIIKIAWLYNSIAALQFDLVVVKPSWLLWDNCLFWLNASIIATPAQHNVYNKRRRARWLFTAPCIFMTRSARYCVRWHSSIYTRIY